MSVEVSIIVPNYNHLTFIKQRLDSIFNQTFQDFEVILLDDASTDGSQELLKSYNNHPKISHLVINEINTGSPFKQWERGIQLAKGKFIWIAESDDYSDSRFLETLLADISDYKLAYSQSIDINEAGIRIGDRLNYTGNFIPNLWKDDFEIDGEAMIRDYFILQNVIPNASAVIFDKKLINGNIFSDDLVSMKLCGDWLFWIKICKKAKVLFINKELNYFRTHSNVSRVHNDIEKKKQRFAEEYYIRRYMFENFNIASRQKNRELIKQWVFLHKVSDLTSKNFYLIAPKLIDRLWLFINFLSVKGQNYLK